jgi:hypothetical protein
MQGFDIRVQVNTQGDPGFENVSDFVAKAIAAYAENNDGLGRINPNNIQVIHVARIRKQEEEECTTES